jgi:hypothetical protein
MTASRLGHEPVYRAIPSHCDMTAALSLWPNAANISKNKII